MSESLYIQSFIRYLTELDPGLKQIGKTVSRYVKPFHCPAGSPLEINQTKEILYIFKGLMAGHLISESPKITCWLATEHELSLPGIAKNHGDKMAVQAFAIEDTEGLLVTLSLFTQLSAGRTGKCIGDIICRKFLLAASADAVMVRKSMPSQKLRYFHQRYPGLADRVPDNEIASYLGISIDDLDAARKENGKH
jgi:hypothetical protein